MQNKTLFQKKNLIQKPLKTLRHTEKPSRLLKVSTPEKRLLCVLFSKLKRKSLQLTPEEINFIVVAKWFRNRYPTMFGILVTEDTLYRIELILFL